MSAPLDMPYNLTAERAILSVLLQHREAIHDVAGWLQPAHFYLEKHAWVYEAIVACYGRREPADRATVTSELERQGRYAPIGGAAFFYELFTAAGRVSAGSVAAYAATVEQAAAARDLIATGGEITILGYDTARPLDERLREAEQRLFAIGQRRRLGRDFVTLSQVAAEVLDWLAGDDDPGLSTGFPDLDAILGGGFQPGDLVIVAARPSMGKTALALTLLYHICAERQHPAQLFSLEMSRRQLALRLVAMRSGMDVQRLRPGRMRAAEIQQATEALADIALSGVLVDDTPCEDILAMRAKARRAALEATPAVIIVDYLGLAEASGENRVQQVSAITRHLKAMAREIGCPVIALSQLSRAVEGRASKVPVLSDLRDSGSVEQDADTVLFLHREEYYDKAAPRGGAEIHVAKQRNGPLGVVPLYFEARTTRFHSAATYAAPEGYA